MRLACSSCPQTSKFQYIRSFKHATPTKVCATRGATAIRGYREVTDNLLLQQPIVHYYNLKPFNLHNCSSSFPISLSKQCKFIMYSWENEVLNRPQDTSPTIKITHYNVACNDTIESKETLHDLFRVDLSAGFVGFPVSSHALFIDEGLTIVRQENWKNLRDRSLSR